MKIIRGNLSESGINELALSLEKARVLEKDIAYWGILVLLEQIKIEDRERCANTKYMVERMLDARKDSLLEMIDTTQSGRLGILREAFKGRNKILKIIIHESIDYLGQQIQDLSFKACLPIGRDGKACLSGQEEARLNIRGILNNVTMKSYLGDPVFGGAKRLLGNCQRLLLTNAQVIESHPATNKSIPLLLLRSIENNLNYAKNNLKSISRKLDRAGYVSFFIAHFRDKFVEASLASLEKSISKEEVFDSVFKAYLKRAGLNKASPLSKIAQAQMWRTIFWLWAFVPPRIKNPLNRRQKIPNPDFVVISKYIDIQEKVYLRKAKKIL